MWDQSTQTIITIKMSKNLITNVFASTNLHILGQTLCVCSIGTCTYSLMELVKNNWANEKILSLLDLLSITDYYSTKNLIGKEEVLVCVTKKDLENMDEQEKANFVALFTYCEDNRIKRLFDDYVKNGESFYLSCVPNIGDGTFHINNISKDFEYLDICKNIQKYKTVNRRAMLAFLMLGCACMTFSLSKVLK